MAPARLSKRIKRLADDFGLVKGEYRLSPAKLKAWVAELDAVPVGERSRCAAEIVALARRFEERGGPGAQYGVAQLYFCAAGLLQQAAVAHGWNPKR